VSPVCFAGIVLFLMRERIIVIDTHTAQLRLLTRRRKREPGAAGCAMAVMGKASSPGRTKTRLVPPLSAADAARLNTAFLQDIIGNLLHAGREMPIAPHVAFGPAGSEAFFRTCLPANLPLIDCSLPNFGDCLDLAITSQLQRGHAAACVLNADSPTLPTRVLIQAARALEGAEDRVVIGPSTDGGYYLLGVKRAHRRLFEDIEWSTPRVFDQTRQRAAELDLRVTVLEEWYDVDDAAGLQRLRTDLAADDLGASDGIYPAPNTRAALTHLTCPAPGVSIDAARAPADR